MDTQVVRTRKVFRGGRRRLTPQVVEMNRLTVLRWLAEQDAKGTGLNMSWIAEATKFGGPNFSRFMNQKGRPSYGVMQRIATQIGTSIDPITGRFYDPQSPIAKVDEERRPGQFNLSPSLECWLNTEASRHDVSPQVALTRILEWYSTLPPQFATATASPCRIS